MLDGSFLSDSFQESLKPSSFIKDVQSLADRSKMSFDDIHSFTKSNSSGKTGKGRIGDDDASGTKRDLLTKELLHQAHYEYIPKVHITIRGDTAVVFAVLVN